jgi:F420-non-reducing hydrogenase iron-sulfur subunit
MSATTAMAPPAAAAPAPAPAGGVFEPLILGFTCNWCSYRAADLAGTARMKYPPNVRLVRLMCSGRLDPAFVLSAFAQGADTVIVSGCWPGECHYQVQNLKALRRFQLLRRVVAGLGIEPTRLQLVWASAAEGQRLASEIGRITEEVRALGPLGWGAGTFGPDAAQVAPGAVETRPTLVSVAPPPSPQLAEVPA